MSNHSDDDFMLGMIIGSIIDSSNHRSKSGCLGVILAVLAVPAWIAWIIIAA